MAFFLINFVVCWVYLQAPFSRLLSGGSLESVVQELTSLQTTAASSSPAPPSAPQQKSASTTDLSTIEHATALSVKRKRFSAQHVAQRLGKVFFSVLEIVNHSLCSFGLPISSHIAICSKVAMISSHREINLSGRIILTAIS